MKSFKGVFFASLLLFSCLVEARVYPFKVSSLSRNDQEAFIRSLLANMTLSEKIGQMTQPDHRYIKSEDIKKYAFGSILRGGGGAPSTGNNPLDWAGSYDEAQRIAVEETRLGVPLIYGQDAVHGVNNVNGAVVFPHHIALGCANDADLMSDLGAMMAEELAACGTSWAFAPCVATGRDDRWGRIYESFSEDPSRVQALVGSYIKAIQAAGKGYEPPIVACAKHYAGDGGAEWGTGRAGYHIDRGDVSVNESEFRRLHVDQYRVAVAAGVASVMPSYSSWKGTQMSMHKYLLTDVLKKEITGFDGFLISDYNAVWDLPGTDVEKVASSINAGMDMMMVPDTYVRFINTLNEAIEKNLVSQDRIDDAVLRILRIKARFGLFDHPYSSRATLDKFGSQAHREVARKAVQKSAVLLKNREGVLPLKKNMRILVAGQGANDIGLQCGGWTISWQGSIGNITKGTTIWQAVSKIVSENGGLAEFYDHTSQKVPAGPFDRIIYVFSEKPYAEGHGDSKTLEMREEDVKVLEKVIHAHSNVPLVSVALTGRPLIVTNHLSSFSAFVAAFWPGTETGTGLADVLFGDVPFQGTLSVSWPKNVKQEPINVGDKKYDPLYPYGFGLKL